MEDGKKGYISPVLTVDLEWRNVFLESSDPAKDDFSWDEELIGG